MAIARYARSLKLCEAEEAFWREFDASLEYLLQYGIAEADLESLKEEIRERNKHLDLVNYILVSEEEILVGATDSERWRWDREEGASGADAKTIVYVTLKGKARAYTSEEAGFHCGPGDPVRYLAMQLMPELFAIAWRIRREGFSEEEARDWYFGRRVQG